MTRLRVGAAAVLLGAACTIPSIAAHAAEAEAAEATPAPVAEPEAAPAPGAVRGGIAVRDVALEPMDGGRRVRIVLSRPADGVRNFTLPDPPRLVVDLVGAHAPTDGRETRFPLTDDLVTRARVAPYGPRLRVVLDLTRKAARQAIRSHRASVVVE